MPGDSGIRLMAGAYAPAEPQEHPEDGVRGLSTATSAVAPLLPSVGPLLPTSAASGLGSAGGAAAVDLAAAAARVAPAVVGAAASAPAALAAAIGTMVYPTNTGSDTTDIGDGLRVRTRPGQRSVEIERRVHNGLLNTGIGARWETLPVDAWQQVNRDGSVDTVVNHEQLNRVLGVGPPAQPQDAGATAMAQTPQSQQRPAPTAGSANAPGAGIPGATGSLAPAQAAAAALAQAKQPNPDEERLLACRAVMALPGRQAAPSGQFNGPGGIGTNVGIDVSPSYPTPKGGYDYNRGGLRNLDSRVSGVSA